jgi:hypothetical protein
MVVVKAGELLVEPGCRMASPGALTRMKAMTRTRARNGTRAAVELDLGSAELNDLILFPRIHFLKGFLVDLPLHQTYTVQREMPVISKRAEIERISALPATN